MPNPFRHLLPHFRRQWRLFAVGVIALLATNWLQQYIPRILRSALDALQNIPADASANVSAEMQHAALMGVLVWAAWRFGTVVLISLLRYGWRMGFFGMGRQVEYSMRAQLFGKLLTLSAAFFRQLRVGDLLSRAMSDLGAVRESLGFGWMALIDSVSTFAFTAYFMMRVDAKLSLEILWPMLFIPPLVMTLGRKVRDNGRQAQGLLDGLSQTATESFSGARVVHAFARQGEEAARFEKASDGYRLKNLKLVYLEAFYWPILTLIAGISEVLLFILGGQRVALYNQAQALAGHPVTGVGMSIGTFAMFQEYLMQIVWPVMALGFSSNMYIRGRVSLERLNEVYDAKAAILDPGPGVTPGFGGGQELLRLDRVSFRYAQGPAVLSGVGLTVQPGEWVGLAGRTGCGKTSLLKLLPRLEDPAEGQVLLWGRELKDWPLKALRRRVAMVMQEPFLFSETILENIAFSYEGNAQDRFDEALAAAKAADFHETVAALPQGYHSLLGEKGVNLSGGQKQRLALARALFAQPDLLVLDDSFSALDTATEERIVSGLKLALPNAGVVLVSHRVSTLRLCSRVLVLDHGRIAEQGRPDELMQMEGAFFDMARREQLARKAGLA
jgi:ATP-binding cassette subfamily B multidrug efflux pump